MSSGVSPARPRAQRRSARLLAVALAVMVVALAAASSTARLSGCLGGHDVNAGQAGNGGRGGTGGAAQGPGITIAWYGHAAFLITSPKGVRVLTDPYPGNLGYGNRRFSADIVTVSHEHFDHNSVASVEGDPVALRGLDGSGGWASASKTVDDVTVSAIGGSYHDAEQGSKRGKNSFFLIEAGGLRLLHLGDLGEVPSKELVDKAGRVDVLFIPVGGFFTIDGPTAVRVAALFGAKVVIPMHYKTRAIADWQISDEQPFIEGQPGVKRVGTSQVVLDPAKLPANQEIWILEPAPEGS